MAQHWTSYTGQSLTDKQVRALDSMARTHGMADGLAVLAAANGLSRSKAGKLAADRHKVRDLLDEAFTAYGRK